MPAPVPAGIVYGLYLTLSSWVLFYVATHMSFFKDNCNLADLNTTNGVLVPYCQVGPIIVYVVPCHGAEGHAIRYTLALLGLVHSSEMLTCGMQDLITSLGLSPTAPVTAVYPGQIGKDADLASITVLDQCITEQTYVRDSITRSLLYNQARSHTDLPIVGTLCG